MSKFTKAHSVEYNLFMNSLLKLSDFILPLITFPYISRVLGVEGNGQISFAGSFISCFLMFASLGIPTYGVRACAQCREDKEELSRTLQELLCINIVTAAISYAAMIFIVLAVPKLNAQKEILWILSLSVILAPMSIDWFYQSMEDFGYITYRELAYKVLSVLLIFTYVKGKDDILIYAGIIVLGTVGAALFNLIRIKRYIYCYPLKPYQLKRHIEPIILLFLLSAAAMVYTNLDTFMLGFMSDNEQVGYYSVAIKMKIILVSFVTVLGTVLLPRVSYYIEKGMEKEFVETIRKSVRFVVVSALPLSIFFMLESKDTILFLAGDKYMDAVPAMIAIMPTVLFIGLSNIIGIQIFIPHGKEKYTTYSTIAGAIIDFVLNAAFIPKLGAIGAAIGTTAAEGGVLAVQILILFSNKNKKLLQIKQIDWKDIGITVLSAAVAVVFMCGFKYAVTIEDNFFSFIANALVYWSIYGIACLIQGEKIMINIRDLLLSAIKTKGKRK